MSGSRNINEIIQAIADELKTQDNRSTAEPIYVVQQRRRIYGLDPEFLGDKNVVWIDDCNDCAEISGEEAAVLEEKYQATCEVPPEYTRTGYEDTWEFVQPFFTSKGAESFIEENAHRLTDPRVYVDSAYRNKEWKAVRALLLAMNPQVTYQETSLVSDPPDPFCRLKEVEEP